MSTFKVMTWNVENLFRPPLSAAVEMQQRYREKLQLLAVIISRQAPDIVCLQEIGGEDALLDLQQALGGLYGHRAASQMPGNRGIRVAFLSQQPIVQAQDVVDFPPGPALRITELSSSGETPPITRMGRGALHIEIAQAPLNIHLIGLHLKSKLLSFPRASDSSFTPRDETERAQVAGLALRRRTAEAVTLRLYANQLLTANQQTQLLLLGDFNDVPEAQTSLLFNGPPGSEIEGANDSNLGFHRSDKGDDVRLFNLSPLIALERRYSRIYRQRRELLDQIMVSEELLPLVQGRRRLPRVDSWVDFAGQLASIEDNPAGRISAIAPDHAPVVAEFERSS